ncbi:hypothetical protein RD792_005864 [Penstemon davidsonii]|uniref:Peptidase C1A papain C-terminal domain-containing protein n=1 Tax=Penstemon davidsonii TaxID=160366 RepID=A0ABR0DFF8_9LAMI|nr:hypothetical protein RD792_005864 [Penstemon davidsonii]
MGSVVDPRPRWSGFFDPRPPQPGTDYHHNTLVPQFESCIILDSLIREKHELWIDRYGHYIVPKKNYYTGAWTFLAADAVEGITKIKNGKLYNLSIQEILDCDTGAEGNGCDGGFVSEAFDFIKQNGLTTESNYPSKEKPGTCDKNKEAQHVAKISSYEKIPADNEAALMKAVANQPIAVSLDASGPSFQFYSSGVFTGQCGTTLDHVVTVVGYGTENGKLKYWIIKNSWGTTWGEEGYMKLQRDTDEKEGLCGIAMDALYPVV